MRTETLHFELDAEGVGTLTLARPPANAINVQMLDELYQVLERLQSDTDVRTVIVRSDARLFCGGADIRMTNDFLDDPDRRKGVEEEVAFGARLQRFNREFEALPFPTIAAIDGAATGGGLELALACDLRVAAETARLGLPEVLLGMIPGAGGTQQLTRTVGRANAARLILSGELVSGKEAEQMGLVQWTASGESAFAFAVRVAKRLAGLDMEALHEAKRCVLLAPSEAGYAAEGAGYARLLNDEATFKRVRDRVKAFLAGDRRENGIGTEYERSGAR